MKCQTLDLSKFYDGELSSEDMNRVAEHLNDCPMCNETILALHAVHEQQEESLPLNPVEVNDAWADFQTRLNQESNSHTTTRSNKKGVFTMKKKHVAYIAAAVLALTIMTPPVQTMANDLISKAFQTHVEETPSMIPNQETLAEEREKVENGQYTTPDSSVNSITDQGLTLNITEIYIAEARVSFHYTIVDENGKKLENVKATDLHHPDEYFPLLLTQNGEELEAAVDANEPGFMTFDLFDKNVTSGPIDLTVNMNRIQNTKGNWAGNIPLK